MKVGYENTIKLYTSTRRRTEDRSAQRDPKIKESMGPNIFNFLYAAQTK